MMIPMPQTKRSLKKLEMCPVLCAPSGGGVPKQSYIEEGRKGGGDIAVEGGKPLGNLKVAHLKIIS